MHTIIKPLCRQYYKNTISEFPPFTLENWVTISVILFTIWSIVCIHFSVSSIHTWYIRTYVHRTYVTYVRNIRTYVRTYVRTYLRTYLRTYIHSTQIQTCRNITLSRIPCLNVSRSSSILRYFSVLFSSASLFASAISGSSSSGPSFFSSLSSRAPNENDIFKC